MDYIKFLEMSEDKRNNIINNINNALLKCEFLPDNLYINHEHIKQIIEDYVRTDEDVIDHNISYFEIRCPIEMLDTESMIDNDNDYVKIIDGYHLYTDCISTELDMLIEDGILIEIKPDEAIDLYRKNMEDMWEYTSEAIEEYIGGLVTYGGDSTEKIYKAMLEVLKDIENNKEFTDKEGFIEAILAEEYFQIK